MRYTRFLAIGLLAVAPAACDRFSDSADGQQPQQVDPAQLTSSGEVSLTDGGSMSFSITRERYKQWDQARRGFPKSLITRYGQVLQPRAPSERSINNAVALLEGNAQAKRAIEQAGLSVRGFVEITVALEQQMQMASTSRADVAPPLDATYPMTMDSGYYPMPAAVYEPPPVTPLPQPYPAQPYPAQTYPTPQPYTPVLPPSRDTVRRDTLLPTPTPTPVPAPTPTPAPTPPPSPRPDTTPVRRDTVVSPTPRRDTSVAPKPAPAPPDSLPRW